MPEKRERRIYSDEFKNQIIQLYLSGKKKAELIREYNLTPSALDRWVKQASSSSSFREKDNRSDEENELLLLRKQNKQLLMENDILKQAALIFGRK